MKIDSTQLGVDNLARPHDADASVTRVRGFFRARSGLQHLILNYVTSRYSNIHHAVYACKGRQGPGLMYTRVLPAASRRRGM